MSSSESLPVMSPKEIETEIKKTLQIKCLLHDVFYKGLINFMGSLKEIITDEIKLEFFIDFFLLHKSLNTYYIKSLYKKDNYPSKLELTAMKYCGDFGEHITKIISRRKKIEKPSSGDIGELLLFIFFPSPKFINLYVGQEGHKGHKELIKQNIILSFGMDTFTKLFKPLMDVLDNGFNNPKVRQILASENDDIELELELTSYQQDEVLATKERERLTAILTEMKKDEEKCVEIKKEMNQKLVMMEKLQEKLAKDLSSLDEDSFVKVEHVPVEHSAAAVPIQPTLGSKLYNTVDKATNYISSFFKKGHQAKYLKYKAKYLALKKLLANKNSII